MSKITSFLCILLLFPACVQAQLREEVIDGETVYGFYGAILAAITLLMLLLGQRVAKDYAGAQTIVVYLIPTIFLLYLMQ